MTPGEVEQRLTGPEAWATLRYLDNRLSIEQIVDHHLSKVLSYLTALGGKQSEKQDHSLLYPRPEMTEEEDGLAWLGLLGQINERVNKT